MPTPHRRTQAHLRNLLARIHRDGGHYTEAQGLEASVAAADGIVAKLWGENDAMREALQSLVSNPPIACADGQPATHAWLPPETRRAILAALSAASPAIKP